MARGLHGAVLGQIRTLFDEGALATLSDGDLLGRFLDDRGHAGEAAFTALVRRHGSLVFGVCRRILRDEHQTEDAFQATFLIFASKARLIRNREAVGPWLVGVAGKVAARAKGQALRRQALEGRAAGLVPSVSPAEPIDHEELAILLREVASLRRPLRDAVVLCYLQSLTYESAADALGVTETTLRGRLARAKSLLRDRLSRRGISRDTSALIAFPCLEVAPVRLVDSTTQGALAQVAGRAMAGMISESAIILMKGALKAMFISKIQTGMIVAMGISLITLGTAVRVHAWQKPSPRETAEAKQDAAKTGDAKGFASLLDGRIIRSADVTKDCMILSYIPDWNFGNVDNIGIANNDGGVRTLVDWPDIPLAEANSANLKFFLAFYSKQTTVKPKSGSIFAFELIDNVSNQTGVEQGTWPERTSWKSKPSSGEDPVATFKFEPGEGWKFFEITSFVKEKAGKSGKGLMLRFLNEDRSSNGEWSGYTFVSREGQGEWADRHPRLLVVEPAKK